MGGNGTGSDQALIIGFDQHTIPVLDKSEEVK